MNTSKVNTAFATFNKSWTNLNGFNDNNLESLLKRKGEIEDWFRWHPDHPDEPAMREQYQIVNDKIKNFNTSENERPKITN